MLNLRQVVKHVANRVPTVATAVDYARFRLSHTDIARKSAGGDRALLDALKRDGYVVVPGYKDEAFCKRCITDFEEVMVNKPEVVRRNSDLRVFGAEALSPSIAEFSTDAFLGQMASSYMQASTVNAFTLVNKVETRADSMGSGEGWHKDASFRQFKAFLYLNDVGEHNGPLQLVARSHWVTQYVHDMRAGELPFRQLRIRDEQMEKILRESGNRLVNVTGKRGTLILADTACIHRGRPPMSGERYALTNYYVEPWQITPEFINAYSPVSVERLRQLRQSQYKD